MEQQQANIVAADAVLRIPNRALRIGEVATFAAVSVREVWRFVAKGTLPVVRYTKRCTRVYPSDFVAFLRRFRPDLAVEVE